MSPCPHKVIPVKPEQSGMGGPHRVSQALDFEELCEVFVLFRPLLACASWCPPVHSCPSPCAGISSPKFTVFSQHLYPPSIHLTSSLCGTVSSLTPVSALPSLWRRASWNFINNEMLYCSLNVSFPPPSSVYLPNTPDWTKRIFSTSPTSNHASPFQPSDALHGTSVRHGIAGNSVENAHSQPPLPEKSTFRRAGVGPQTCILKTTPGGSHPSVLCVHKKTSFQSYPITFSSSHHPVTPFVPQLRLFSSHPCYRPTKFLFTLPGSHPMSPPWTQQTCRESTALSLVIPTVILCPASSSIYHIFHIFV